MEVSGIFPDGEKEVEMVKLAFIATDGECRNKKSRQRHITYAGEDVLKVFGKAIEEQSTEPVRNYLIDKISELAEVTYGTNNFGKAWLEKAEFMTWIETMKHLQINTAPLHEVELDVKVKCCMNDIDEGAFMLNENLGLNDIDEVKGAFMLNENLVMSAICDIMTVEQIEALWELCCNKKELKMVTPGKNALQINFETVGMKELTFFYIIRRLELSEKFNTLFPDSFLDYIEEIRDSVGNQEKLDQVCEILQRYEIRVQPAGYCLVFCMIKNREGAQTEIDNIQDVFGDLLGYKVNVVENPNRKDIEDVVDNFSKEPFHSMFDSLVCWVLAHGDTENIYLASEKKLTTDEKKLTANEKKLTANERNLTRKDFLKLFSKETCFSKKPKLFFMAPCQGEKCIEVADEEKKDGMDTEADMPVKTPPFSDTDYNIVNLHAESDRLIAYATMPEHKAHRHTDTGSIYVSIICKQIEDLKKHPNSSITVEDVLKRTARKMQSILFQDKETQAIGKQACYYESALQKDFIFRLKNNST